MFLHLEVNRPEWISFIMGYFRGVPIFFMLTGYLVWQSVDHTPCYSTYLKKRFLRIYPELWGAVAVEIVTMLLLYRQSVPLAHIGAFTFTQATIFQFWTPSSLRGYGCGTPNGALWTICVIIQFYIVVWALYKWLHKKSAARWGGAMVLFVAMAVVIDMSEGFLPATVYKLLCQTVPHYLWLFGVGMAIAEFKDKLLGVIKRFWPLFLLLVTVYMLLPIEVLVAKYDLIKTVLLFCGWLGFAYQFPKLNIKTDISYGLYLYHMTIVNAMIAMGYTGKSVYIIVAIALSCIVSYISTVTVGKFSKKMKRRIAA